MRKREDDKNERGWGREGRVKMRREIGGREMGVERRRNKLEN